MVVGNIADCSATLIGDSPCDCAIIGNGFNSPALFIGNAIGKCAIIVNFLYSAIIGKFLCNLTICSICKLINLRSSIINHFSNGRIIGYITDCPTIINLINVLIIFNFFNVSVIFVCNPPYECAIIGKFINSPCSSIGKIIECPALIVIKRRNRASIGKVILHL